MTDPKIESKARDTIMDEVSKLMTNKDELLKIIVDMKIGDPTDEKAYPIIGKLVVHCMCNGPVGVAKQTTFPFGSSGSIISLSTIKGLTNKKWTSLCHAVATHIKTMLGADYSKIECPAMTLLRDLWPLQKWTSKA
jgi:hypothetical protein